MSGIKSGDVLLIYQFPVEKSLIVLVEDINGTTVNTHILKPELHKKKNKLVLQKKKNGQFMPISFDTSLLRYLPGNGLALTILNEKQIEDILSNKQFKELIKIKKDIENDVDLFA